jgi:hypothetical protein
VFQQKERLKHRGTLVSGDAEPGTAVTRDGGVCPRSFRRSEAVLGRWDTCDTQSTESCIQESPGDLPTRAPSRAVGPWVGP